MRVIMADLPPALTTDMIRQAVKTDRVYQDLKEAIRSGIKRTDLRLSPYMSVWTELAVIKGLVARGERIVIPEGRVKVSRSHSGIGWWSWDTQPTRA